MITLDFLLTISYIDVLIRLIFFWLNVLFAGVSGSIAERTRQLGKIKDEKNKLKVFFWTSTVILSYGCWC